MRAIRGYCEGTPHATVQLGKSPRVHPSAFVAPTAVIIGDATIEERASVWYNAVVRADFQPIVIRAGANVQDCAVLHVNGGQGVEVGPGATIGHNCTVRRLARRGVPHRQRRHRARRRARRRPRDGGPAPS
jgi:UDP-3-O-[3-hydroxymyristoyl] glucosamine N-acyltransferase